MNRYYQKANKWALLSIILLTVILACRNSPENELAIFKALDESIIVSNQTISRQNETIIHDLKEKLLDPATHKKAEIWFPRALLIKSMSDTIISYIEGLKSDLKKEAGAKMENGKASFKENDRDAVDRLFRTKGKGNELYELLRHYNTDILRIDPRITSEFNNTIVLTTQSFDSSENKQQDFTASFFDNIPVVPAQALLSKFQNNIKVIENRMISFCHNNCYSTILICTFYMPLIAQSSSYVKAGEKIEITAGVGAFTSQIRPEININGRKVNISETGTAIYSFKASVKPGKHFVPVKITYADLDGKKQTVVKVVEYTVADFKGDSLREY